MALVPPAPLRIAAAGSLLPAGAARGPGAAAATAAAACCAPAGAPLICAGTEVSCCG